MVSNKKPHLRAYLTDKPVPGFNQEGARSLGAVDIVGLERKLILTDEQNVVLSPLVIPIDTMGLATYAPFAVLQGEGNDVNLMYVIVSAPSKDRVNVPARCILQPQYSENEIPVGNHIYGGILVERLPSWKTVIGLYVEPVRVEASYHLDINIVCDIGKQYEKERVAYEGRARQIERDQERKLTGIRDDIAKGKSIRVSAKKIDLERPDFGLMILNYIKKSRR